jgi:hypothetical protein
MERSYRRVGGTLNRGGKGASQESDPNVYLKAVNDCRH